MNAQRLAQQAVKNADKNIKEAEKYKISASMKDDTRLHLSINPHSGEIIDGRWQRLQEITV